MQKRLKIQKYDFRKEKELDKQLFSPAKPKGMGQDLTGHHIQKKNDPWPQLPTPEKMKSRSNSSLSFRKIKQVKRKASVDFHTPDKKRKKTNVKSK